MSERRLVTLLADAWRNLLWCGMIGAAIALVISVINVMRTAPAPGNSPGIDIAAGVMVGIVMGVLLLGIPSCLWTVGRWMFASPQHQTTPNAAPVAQTAPVVAGQLAQDASHGAMVGSTAAIPGAIAGGLGGFLLVAGYVARSSDSSRSRRSTAVGGTKS